MFYLSKDRDLSVNEATKTFLEVSYQGVCLEVFFFPRKNSKIYLCSEEIRKKLTHFSNLKMTNAFM